VIPGAACSAGRSRSIPKARARQTPACLLFAPLPSLTALSTAYNSSELTVDVHCAQKVARKGLELLGSLPQPGWTYWVGLKIRAMARIPQPLASTPHAHDQLSYGLLTSKWCRDAPKVAVTCRGSELPPGPPLGCPLARKVAQSQPTAIVTHGGGQKASRCPRRGRRFVWAWDRAVPEVLGRLHGLLLTPRTGGLCVGPQTGLGSLERLPLERDGSAGPWASRGVALARGRVA